MAEEDVMGAGLGFSDDGMGAYEGRKESACSSPVPSGALVQVLEIRKLGEVLRMTIILDATT
jgi:hypothetical protein